LPDSNLHHGSEDPGAQEHLGGFYRMGAVSAISLLVVILLSGAAYVIRPYLPGSVPTASILEMIHQDRLGGFLGLDGLLVLGNLVGVPLFVALYASFKNVHGSFALLALTLGIMGVALIFPARPISELMALSDRYAAAASDAAKLQYLSAAEATLARFGGTTFQASTFLGGLSLLISSLLMLRSALFGRATAYVGIATNVAVCGFLLPGIGTALLFLSVPGYLIWNALLAWRFNRLARQGGKPLAHG
jgi:hypothetical protein